MDLNEQDYYVGEGKTPREAIKDLRTIITEAVVTVSTRKSYQNQDGKQKYEEATDIDSTYEMPQDSIILVPVEGYWRAFIRKTFIKQKESVWIEEHNVINNTYNEAPRYDRSGAKVEESTTETTRNRTVISPSGERNVTPGRTTITKRHKDWNGRSGATWEYTDEPGEALNRGLVSIGVLSIIALTLVLLL